MDLLIHSLEGGLSTKAPTSLFDNQCSYAQNVEFFRSRCGERRLGSAAVDVSGGDLATCDRIVWVFRHMPTTDYRDAQLWALGITDGTPDTATLAYKDTTWHTVAVSDAFTLDGASEFQVCGCSLHGKLFIAYNAGSTDRLHVWDGTSLRRTGLAQPAAPTGADSGGAGTIADVRYYRVRYTVQSGGVTLRRSEPSTALTFTPGGSNASVTVTKPATISEGETHWELEASTDNVLFYLLATTVVGTTTVVDSTADGAGYASGTLSEDIGDYSLIPSVRYLSVDGDRLMAAGSFEDADLDSRVMWTPVSGDPGVGNDERLALDTDPYLDLDNYEGGDITALSENVNGYIYVLKLSHVYQGVRTGERERAYEFVPITKSRGALPGTVVVGVDNNGHPSLFGLDPHIGPIRIGGEGGGVESCGTDLFEVWRGYRAGAVATAATTQRSVFVAEKQQVQFWVPGANVALVLHTQHMRRTEEGFRGGWAFWTKTSNVYSVCLYATNIDDDTDRTLTLRPFLGTDTDLISRSDTGQDDNGEDYIASVATRQFLLGNFLNDAEVKDVVVYGQALTGAALQFNVSGLKADYGIINDSAVAVSFAPNGSGAEGASFHYANGFGARHLDGLGLSEIKGLWVTFGDPSPPTTTAQWAIDAIAVRYELGAKG